MEIPSEATVTITERRYLRNSSSITGFPALIERTEHDYFRVGSEAINFQCNYFTKKCTVRHTEHNVFR